MKKRTFFKNISFIIDNFVDFSGIFEEIKEYCQGQELAGYQDRLLS